MTTNDADDWDAHWDSYADSAQDNPAQQYRRKLIAEQLQATDPVSVLVDAGAGQGDLLRDLQNDFPNAELWALEPSEVGRKWIERDLPRVTALAWDGMSEPAPDQVRGKASHLVCSEVLEHVDDPTRVLRNAVAALAPGGLAVVTVPGGPKTAFDRHIGHRQHFRGDGLQTMMQGAGLDDVQIFRAGFPTFNIYKSALLVRGEKLVEDVASGNASNAPGLVMRIFERGFASAVTRNSPFGWQLLGVGKAPGLR